MAEIIYVLTVIYFSYVIYVVLGDEIEAYCHTHFPRYSLVKVKRWANLSSLWNDLFKTGTETWKTFREGPKL